MTEKLSWEEIKMRYDHEWIELVDYDWPEEEACPRAGSVRTHSSNRKEFHQECRREPVPFDSAILYVGRPVVPEGVIFSPSLIRVTSCDK